MSVSNSVIKESAPSVKLIFPLNASVKKRNAWSSVEAKSLYATTFATSYWTVANTSARKCATRVSANLARRLLLAFASVLAVEEK